MKRYSEERKQSVLKKMMPPLNTPISQLVSETGISDCTLYTWRKALRLQGVVVPGNGKNAEDWFSENKFAVVVRDPDIERGRAGCILPQERALC